MYVLDYSLNVEGPCRVSVKVHRCDWDQTIVEVLPGRAKEMNGITVSIFGDDPPRLTGDVSFAVSIDVTRNHFRDQKSISYGSGKFELGSV